MIIEEGSAKIKIYPGEIKKKDKVFYNPKMRVNRDLSVLSVNVFAKKNKRTLRVIDVMSATGIRGIRYLKECDDVNEVVFNDINKEAVKLIEENVKRNGLEKVKIYNEEAGCLLHKYAFLGDVVDLDPFGTPIYYLDAASRAVSNKGMLMITFTDTAVLSGTYPKVCYRRYNCQIDKQYRPHQEMAIRVALSSIARSLSKFDKAMVPYLSVVSKHFLRVIVGISKRKKDVLNVLENIGEFRKEYKDKKFVLKNVWLSDLGNKDFVDGMLELAKENISKEALSLLERLSKEYSIKNAGYYDVAYLSSLYKKSPPSFDTLKEKFGSVEKAHFEKDFVVVSDKNIEEFFN